MKFFRRLLRTGFGDGAELTSVLDDHKVVESVNRKKGLVYTTQLTRSEKQAGAGYHCIDLASIQAVASVGNCQNVRFLKRR